MAPMTSYGSWTRYCMSTGPMDDVVAYTGEFGGQYDLDAVVSDYTDAINAALEETGFALVGDEFIGPADIPDDVLVDAIFYEAVESVDLGGLCRRHDISEAFAERIQAHVDDRIALADAAELLDFAYLKLDGGQYDMIVHGRVPMTFHAGVSSLDELEKAVDGPGTDVHDEERFVKTPGGFFELAW